MATTIRTLDELLAVLRTAPRDHNDGALVAYAEQYGLPVAHGLIDWTSLPTFGGTDPEDTTGVWSWDATRVLVGASASDLQIVERTAACAYCGALVSESEPVPAASDDAAWERLAHVHGAGCEWIGTRAHRIDD